jgi:transposase
LVIGVRCIVPKPLTLYTQQSRTGKRNKVVKLTDKKIKYIIRAKTNIISPKHIALEIKVSESTVKRVWMYWMKNRELLTIKKFGRNSQELDEESVELILETHKKQKLGARRLEKIIGFEHGIHIPHSKIHKVLLEHGLANEGKNKKKRRRPWIQIRTRTQFDGCASISNTLKVASSTHRRMARSKNGMIRTRNIVSSSRILTNL